MNEWSIYIALYCVLLYTQSALQSYEGGSLLNHHQCTASTWMMRRQPQRSPHTSYRWRGERVIEPIKWMGIIGRPWLTRASGRNLARTGYTPTLYDECHGILNDHRESGPRFNVSSERLESLCPSLLLRDFASLRHPFYVTDLMSINLISC